MSDTKNREFLSVENLFVEYTAGGKVIQAVNGVSFRLERAKPWALWEKPAQEKPPLQRRSCAFSPILPPKLWEDR